MGEYVFVKHCVYIRGKIVENKALKEKIKVALQEGENQIISNNIMDDDDRRLFSIEDAYIVKADEYCFAITCYEVLI
jgi:hypothetical protein